MPSILIESKNSKSLLEEIESEQQQEQTNSLPTIKRESEEPTTTTRPRDPDNRKF